MLFYKGTDALTADETDTAAAVQKQLQDAMNYQGTIEEKQVRAYLASLGIDYDALTPEEIVTQIHILKKVKALKAKTVTLRKTEFHNKAVVNRTTT